MAMPPKHPYWPPIAASTGTPGSARPEDGAHDFGNGDEARIGFVQTHAARLQQQQHGGGTLARRSFEQADDFRAVHFPYGAAHEAALLGGDQHGTPIERAASDDHAVVEGGRQIERSQMGADDARSRRQDFAE